MPGGQGSNCTRPRLPVQTALMIALAEIGAVQFRPGGSDVRFSSIRCKLHPVQKSAAAETLRIGGFNERKRWMPQVWW